MSSTETTPPAPKQSRAGRNLPAAITVGVLLGGLVIVTLAVLPIWVWVAIVGVAIAVATHEVCSRLGEAGYSIPLIPLLVGGQAMIWLTWWFGPTGALGGFAATMLVCLIWRLLAQGPNAAPQNYLRDVAVTMLLAAWIPLCGAFAALLIYPDNGRAALFTIMLAVVFSDIGGYTAGVLFGKHPMVPAISPKKSWEGFTGSLIAGTGMAVFSVVFLMDQQWWIGIPLGIFLVITGTLGDLVESQFKRDLGIKDMSTLLPGHGGLMDRIDSILLSMAAGWLVLTVLT
ncbi:phosphatidate cytidylyltransferase [Mycolicibacterium brumae]|uniref:phosphatidate cytidylyltransferase n=1 Tax=Mycolicibacterium brumae TaxID=85968 RepID=UPI000B09B657|nr:phosphatidate cytidylyltransferase [Mycolicibacterium brumae]MCV7193888.1 phosphatidate cytidylyltransferase [Mycolicibacterium brumae]UWW08127.1 phosphatidate cytidylyltransferase [Mycolicibacterium brumae]